MRAVVQHLLEELGEEEEHPEHAGGEEEPRDIRRAAAAVSEEPQGRDRLRCTALEQDERRQQDGTDGERAHGQHVTPPGGGGSHERVRQRGDTDGRGQRPANIEVAVAAGRLGEQAAGQRDDHQADRHVDEQHPSPGRPLGEQTPEDQADGAATDRHGGVPADRADALLSVLEHGHEQRQRRGRSQCSANPLQRACSQEPAAPWGHTAEEGRGGEERDAGDEHATATEQVTCAGAEEQEAAEGQRVRGDDPREVRRREVECAGDVGQRDVHDGGVEHDHQLDGKDDREHQAPAGLAPGGPAGRGDESGGGLHWGPPWGRLRKRTLPPVVYGGSLRFAT